jgi:hypothetical protein
VTHTPIQNGDGCYCSRCGQAWDRDEQPPAVCSAAPEEIATGVGRGIEPSDASFLSGGPAMEPRRIVIALCGEKYAGKDTAAAPLLAAGYANVKMADGLKIMLRTMLGSKDCAVSAAMLHSFLLYRGACGQTIREMPYGRPTRFLNGRSPGHAMDTLSKWGREQLDIDLLAYDSYRGADPATIDRMIDGDLKETPSRFLNGRTPRHAMQSLGDWGRNDMQTDFWLDATMDRLDQVGDAVITDVRYPNEAARVRGLGIPLLRVERPDQQSSDAHSSEVQIRTLPVDGVLRNIAVSAEAFQAHAAREFQRLTAR